MKRVFITLLAALMLCIMPLAVNAQEIVVDPDSAGTDAQTALTTALAGLDGQPATVKLGKGTWNITREITVPVNATLDLNGQTVNSSVDYPFILDGAASITNGVISKGGVAVMQGKTAGTISGLSINNAPAVSIYLNGNAGCGDITGNTISGSGDHAIYVNNGSAAGDITNNTLMNCRAHGISIYSGSHVGRITGNHLENIGGKNDNSTGDYAITINAYATSSSVADTYATEIKGNTITGARYASIVVYSQRKGTAGTGGRHKAYIIGDISGNTINGSGTFKRNVNWLNDKKTDCQGGIYVASYADVKGNIHDNVINTSYDDGIDIRGGGTVRSIYNNTVNDAANAGIGVKRDAVVYGDIVNNNIISPRVYGLFINSSSVVKGTAGGNTITDAGQNGIFVTQSGSVNAVTGNTVTNAALYGVITAQKGRISLLSGNTISTSNAKKSMGVLVNSGSCINNILKNNISGRFNQGVRVKSPTAKVNVKRNVIKNRNPKRVRSTGISAEGCKKKVTITNNRITGNKKGCGIYVRKSKSTVKKNKISKYPSKKSVK